MAQSKAGENIEVELEPDAWKRFERAVGLAVKGGPQHRATKKSNEAASGNVSWSKGAQGGQEAALAKIEQDAVAARMIHSYHLENKGVIKCFPPIGKNLDLPGQPGTQSPVKYQLLQDCAWIESLAETLVMSAQA